MSRHLFIAPADIQSPRWQQAFPDALLMHEYTQIAQVDCVWLLVRDARDLVVLESLVASKQKVVVLTMIETAGQARQVMEAGANGYLHYLAAASVLEQVAQVVFAGGIWLGANLMRQLVQATTRSLAVKPANGVPVDLSQLTSRELAVARRVAAGQSNKEVARELDITERTVKAHLGSAFEKLKVRDRLHLALVISATAGI